MHTASYRNKLKVVEVEHPKYLISWLGNADTNNVTKNTCEEGTRGPLLTILEHYEAGHFAQVCVLHTADKPDHILEALCQRVRPFAPLQLHSVPPLDPTHPEDIYAAMLSFLKKLPTACNRYYNLSSGTPAMYSVTLCLSENQFSGTALRTVEKRFAKNGRQVFPVSLPSALTTLKAKTPAVDVTPHIASVNERIFEQVRLKVAGTQATVLILGETGVGKSVLAQHLHSWSDRAQKKMIPINCAEIAGDHTHMRSELFGHAKGAFTDAKQKKMGAFEQANNSTLFLDEIGEIPLALQGMLLRTLETGEVTPLGGGTIKVNVRIIAATNRNLVEEVQRGNFREDLYFRLAQYTPMLHPLRKYTLEDKQRLLKHLLNEVNNKCHAAHPRELDEGAQHELLRAPWPGNIREMKFRLTSICLLSDRVVTAQDVLDQVRMEDTTTCIQPDSSIADDFLPSDLGLWLEKKKKEFIEKALLLDKGNEAKAAKRLGMNPSTLRSTLNPRYTRKH